MKTQEQWRFKRKVKRFQARWKDDRKTNRKVKKKKRRKEKELLRLREEDGRINKGRERVIRRNWSERLEQEKRGRETREINQKC